MLQYHPNPDQFFAQGIIGCYNKETTTGIYTNSKAMTELRLNTPQPAHGAPNHPLEIKSITSLVLSHLSFVERMSTERTSMTFVDGSHSAEANARCHINAHIVQNLHSLDRLLRCKDLEIDFLPDADSPKIQQLKKCAGIQRLWIEDASFLHGQRATMKFVQLIKSILEKNAPNLLSLNINNLGVTFAFFRLLSTTKFPKLRKVVIQDCYSGWKFYTFNTEFRGMTIEHLQDGVVTKALPSLNELAIQNLKHFAGEDKARLISQAINSGLLSEICFSVHPNEFDGLGLIIARDKNTTPVMQMKQLLMSINGRVESISVRNISKMCVSPVKFPTIFVAACIIFQGCDLNHVANILFQWKNNFQHLKCQGQGFGSLRKFVCVAHSQFMAVQMAQQLCESLIVMFKINNKIDFHGQLSWVICQDVNNRATTQVIVLLAELGKILADKDGLVSMKLNCKVQYSYFANTQTISVLEEKLKLMGYEIIVPSHINEALYPTATYNGTSFSSRIELNAFGQQVEMNCPSI